MKTTKEIKPKPEGYVFGRPTKYRPEYAKMLMDYFIENSEPQREIEIKHYDENGNVKWVDKKLVANKIPSLVKFAIKNDIGIATIYNWIDENHSSYQPDFSEVYKHVCKKVRKDMFVDAGMANVTQANTFKFLAMNMTDMTDKSKTELDLSENMAKFLKGIA